MGNNYREKRVVQIPPNSWMMGTHEKTMIATAIRTFSLINSPSIISRIIVV